MSLSSFWGVKVVAGISAGDMSGLQAGQCCMLQCCCNCRMMLGPFIRISWEISTADMWPAAVCMNLLASALLFPEGYISDVTITWYVYLFIYLLELFPKFVFFSFFLFWNALSPRWLVHMLTLCFSNLVEKFWNRFLVAPLEQQVLDKVSKKEWWSKYCSAI